MSCYLTELIPGHHQGHGAAHGQQIAGTAVEAVHRQQARRTAHLIADDVAEQLLPADNPRQVRFIATGTYRQQGEGLRSQRQLALNTGPNRVLACSPSSRL